MPGTWDDLHQLREEWRATLPRDEYRQRVVAKVDEMTPGDFGRAEFLVWLATDFDDYDAEQSLEFAEQAVTDGGPTMVDPRVAVLHALIRLERAEEVDELFHHLLRSSTRDGVTVGLLPALGEVLEQASRLRDAQRAYTVGLREFDPELASPAGDTMDDVFCLGGRFRVRRVMGLGEDRYDGYFERAYPDAARGMREHSVPPSAT